MDCYSFKFGVNGQGALKKGITLKDRHDKGPVLTLGDKSRRMWGQSQFIGCDRYNPPLIHGDTMVKAWLTPFFLPRGGKRFCFSGDDNLMQEVLIHIDTHVDNYHNNRGEWSAQAGTPETVAFSHRGIIPGGWDGLVVMRPGDLLLVTAAAEEKIEWFLHFDSESEQLMAMSHHDYYMRQARKVLDDVDIVEHHLDLYTFDGKLNSGIAFNYKQFPGWEGITVGGNLQTTLKAFVLHERANVATLGLWAGQYCMIPDIQFGFEPTGFIVRVNTTNPNKIKGDIEVIAGNPDVLARGRYGGKGYGPRRPDEVYLMHEGDILKVTREREVTFLFVDNGRLLTASESEWQQWSPQLRGEEQLIAA